jgi:hypothetical protein
MTPRTPFVKNPQFSSGSMKAMKLASHLKPLMENDRSKKIDQRRRYKPEL